MSRSILSLRQVSLRGGGGPLLSDVSFDVQAGEVVRILGDNGSGKSSLLSCIAGVTRVSSGMIIGASGRRIASPVGARIEGVRYALQTPCFVEDWTVLDYLSLVWRASNESETAQRLARWMPEVSVKTSVSNLSFGDRRWLSSVGVIGQRSSLTLLDEPLSGQGETRSVILADGINEAVSEGHSFVVVEHVSVDRSLGAERRLRIEERRLVEG